MRRASRTPLSPTIEDSKGFSSWAFLWRPDGCCFTSQSNNFWFFQHGLAWYFFVKIANCLKFPTTLKLFFPGACVAEPDRKRSLRRGEESLIGHHRQPEVLGDPAAHQDGRSSGTSPWSSCVRFKDRASRGSCIVQAWHFLLPTQQPRVQFWTFPIFFS